MSNGGRGKTAISELYDQKKVKGIDIFGIGVDFLTINIGSYSDYVKQVKNNLKRLKQKKYWTIKNSDGKNIYNHYDLDFGKALCLEAIKQQTEQLNIDQIIENYLINIKDFVLIQTNVSEIKTDLINKIKDIFFVEPNLYFLQNLISIINGNGNFGLVLSEGKGCYIGYIEYFDQIYNITTKIISFCIYKNAKSYGGDITFYGMFFRLIMLGKLRQLQPFFEKWFEVIDGSMIQRLDIYFDYIGDKIISETKTTKKMLSDNNSGDTFYGKIGSTIIRNYETAKQKMTERQKKNYYLEYDKLGVSYDKIHRLEAELHFGSDKLKNMRGTKLFDYINQMKNSGMIKDFLYDLLGLFIEFDINKIKYIQCLFLFDLKFGDYEFKFFNLALETDKEKLTEKNLYTKQLAEKQINHLTNTIIGLQQKIDKLIIDNGFDYMTYYNKDFGKIKAMEKLLSTIENSEKQINKTLNKVQQFQYDFDQKYKIDFINLYRND